MKYRKNKFKLHKRFSIGSFYLNILDLNQKILLTYTLTLEYVQSEYNWYSTVYQICITSTAKRQDETRRDRNISSRPQLTKMKRNEIL